MPIFHFITGVGANVQATPGRVWRWASVARWRQGLLVLSIPALIIANTLISAPARGSILCTTGGTKSCTPAGTTTNNAPSGWTTPNNANTASDHNYASVSIGSTLVASGFDATGFGFSLPSATTAIDGIVVNVQKFSVPTTHNSIQDNTIELLKAGVLTGNNKNQAGVDWPSAAEATITYGSSTDTWGISGLTYSDINASNFGVEVRPGNHKISNPGGSATADIDYISMVVYYTVPPLLTQSAYRFYDNNGSLSTGNGDGATWVQAKNSGNGWNTRRGMASTTFNGAMWIAGGVDNVANTYHNDVWYSTNGTTWTEATSGAAWGARMGAVLLSFNNKLWLIGGFLGTGSPANDVWCSTDGANWSDTTCGSTSAFAQPRQFANGFVFNNKMWIMGGLGNSSTYLPDVYCSSDGTTWSDSTCGTSSAWGGAGRMQFGAGVLGSAMYVWGGVGTSGALLQDVWCSTDGTTWSSSASTGNPCGSGLGGTSSAGWTGGGRSGLTGVVYNNKLWLFGGDGSSDLDDVWSSSNGTTWSQATSAALWSGRDEATSLVYDSQMWIMGGWNQGSPTFYYSDVFYSDGSGQNVNASSGTALANVNTAATSPGDGVPFRLRIDLGVTQAAADVHEVGLNLQYATLSGTCAASTYSNVTDNTAVRFYNTNAPNALNAENIASPTSPTDPASPTSYVGEEYWQQGGGSDFFSNQNSIPTGSDGVWEFALSTYRTQPSTTYCLRIATNAGVAINSYTVYPQITTPSVTTADSSYRFYAQQDAPNAAASWASSGGTLPVGLQGSGVLTYNNTLFVIGGNASTGTVNTVYCSTAGVTFNSTASSCGSFGGTTAAAFSARYAPGAAVFNNTMVIASGSTTTTDVYCSTNGTTWSSASGGCGSVGGTTTAPWTGRIAPELLSFNNKLWLMGGANGNFNFNDVWCSSNGTTWSDTTCGTTGAPWAGRSQFAAWVKDGKMWIAGGVSGTIYFNDVWNSSDGTNWTQVTTGADWSARYAPTSSVHDDLMWIYGGYDGSYKDDAWYSSDGVHWTQQSSAVTGNGHFMPMSTVFNNKLWVLGGLKGAGGQDNEVYNYSFGGIDVGSALTSQNHALDLAATPGSGAATGTAAGTTNKPFRLRWLMNLGGASSSANATAYLKLQYAAMSGGSCSATPSGNFADVSTATAIKFSTSGITTGTNGMPAQPNVNDPTDGTNTIGYQQFQDSDTVKPFTNTKLLIGGNEDGLWDFSLAYAGTSRATSYCLRITDTSHTVSYNQYAQINVGPSPTQLMAHRAWWNSSGVKMWKDVK